MNSSKSRQMIIESRSNLDSGGAVVPCKLIVGDAPFEVYSNPVEKYLRGTAGEYVVRTNVLGFEPTEHRIRLYTQQELKKQRLNSPPMFGIELKRKED